MDVIAALLPRLLLVLLFLPFSAWDKIAEFGPAVRQARTIGFGRGLGDAAIAMGLAIEVVGSALVLTGVADRLAAVVLALYCVATALLYKRWWREDGPVYGDHDTPARADFFDFWKNLAVAGGFLMLALGTQGEGLAALLSDPFGSTNPYGG